jgi:hypothetical protein
LVSSVPGPEESCLSNALLPNSTPATSVTTSKAANRKKFLRRHSENPGAGALAGELTGEGGVAITAPAGPAAGSAAPHLSHFAVPSWFHVPHFAQVGMIILPSFQEFLEFYRSVMSLGKRFSWE